MKRVFIGISVAVFGFIGAAALFLSYIGILPIIPPEEFLPRIQDKEQLIHECRLLVAEQMEPGAPGIGPLYREDYPPEIARLNPHSVMVSGGDDKVIIRMGRRYGLGYGFIVHPKEEAILKYRSN